MTDTLQILIEAARRVQMTPADREAQRRSFMFGNTAIENSCISREMVERIADVLPRGEEGESRRS